MTTTAPSTEKIARCTQCGANNRLRPASRKALPQCGRCHAPLPWLIEADERSFDRELEAPVPVLVDFWAPWCAPCRSIAPVLEQLSGELAGRLKIVKINVDHARTLQLRYGASSIPLLTLFKDGAPVERVVGARPKAQLLQAIAPHLPA